MIEQRITVRPHCGKCYIQLESEAGIWIYKLMNKKGQIIERAQGIYLDDKNDIKKFFFSSPREAIQTIKKHYKWKEVESRHYIAKTYFIKLPIE